MGGTGFVAYFLQGFESTGFRFDSSPRIDKMEPRNPKPSKNKMAPKSVQKALLWSLEASRYLAKRMA